MATKRGLAVMPLLAVAALAWGATPGPRSAPPNQTECPPELGCQFVPAAYAQTVASDPNAYGNYDPANRPTDGNDIRFIVIHDTEISFDAAMRAFGTARSGVSSHYIIRSPDGQITQLVRNKDIAYHAGNYWFNRHSIGIEHEGVAVDGRQWYTKAMYQASARLVRSLAARYQIPLDREHILGHDEIPGANRTQHAAAHYDPGPYWDWEHFFALLGAPLPAAYPGAPQSLGARPVWVDLASYRLGSTLVPTPRVVTIAPRFAPNTQPIQSCVAGVCEVLPLQGSSTVYLRTAPTPDAPLVSDPVLHPDGGPGRTEIGDWSARASAGQSFVVAGRLGEWTAIWFGGQRAWFHDPPGQISTTVAVPVERLFTPRPDRGAIPVYGTATPEPAAYPSGIAPNQVVALPYRIATGQVYLGIQQVRGSDYYARFDGARVPANHTVVVGDRSLWEISFNHRRAFVDSRDIQEVTVAGVPAQPPPPDTGTP